MKMLDFKMVDDDTNSLQETNSFLKALLQHSQVYLYVCPVMVRNERKFLQEKYLYLGYCKFCQAIMFDLELLFCHRFNQTQINLNAQTKSIVLGLEKDKKK